MEPISITESDVSHSPTLRDYLKVIFRHKIIFFILPPALLIPLYFVLELQTPTYQASVKMYIKAMKETEADYYKTIRAISLGEEHAELVKSPIVLERVVEALKLYEIPIDYENKFASPLKKALLERRQKNAKQRFVQMTEEKKRDILYERAFDRLKGSVEASPIRASNFFLITVRDFDPSLAPVIANSVSRSYLIFDLEQQIEELKLKYGEKHSTVVQLKNYITQMQLTLDGKLIPDLEAIGPASIKIIEQAKNSVQKAGLNKRSLMTLSLFASIVLSVIFCFVFEMFDQSIRSQKDIKSILNVPYLGSISKKKRLEKRLISETNPKHTPYSRSFQILSEKLSLLMHGSKLKTILITGMQQPLENASVIANLAFCLSHNVGHKVLIIDADLKKHIISELFKVKNNPGLTDVLNGTSSYMEAIQHIDSNLHILSSGESVSNPVAVFGSSGMFDLLKKAGELYEMVLISTTALSSIADVTVLSSMADGTVIILSEGKERRQVIANTIAPLKQKNVNIIGTILNNHKHVIPKIIYRIT